MSAAKLQPGPLNHIGIPSADPERTAQFYCDVLGFQLTKRPAFSFDGRWLYREEVGPMIHLIHDVNHVPSSDINTRGSHFAMQCDDIDNVVQQLNERGLAFEQRVLPEHEIRQIFFRDPDGNVIELGEWPDVHEVAAFN